MTEADADDLLALDANPNVRRYLGETQLADRDAALGVLRERILPQYRDHGVGRLAIILKRGGAFVGWCGLKATPETKEYDLGYRLLESYWGQGFATEAAAAVLAWAQAKLPAARIVGRAHVENLRSIRVLEKVGLRFDHHEDAGGGSMSIYVRAEEREP